MDGTGRAESGAEAESDAGPKPSVQGLHEELSTELTPLSGKKAIFRDALAGC